MGMSIQYMTRPKAKFSNLDSRVNTPDGDLLLAAVRGHDIAKVKALLEKNISPDCYDEHGCTCLGVAAREGCSDIVALLAQNGADVNKIDFYTQCPLEIAAEFGHKQVAKVLIDAGAKSKVNGVTPLHVALCRDHVEVAQMLLEAGSSVNAQDRAGVSVLHCAVSNGHCDLTARLLDKGANPNIQVHKNERTPLHYATEMGNLEIVKTLVQKGAKLNVQDDFNFTALCIAAVRNETDVGKFLIEAGTKVNLRDWKNNIAIHYTARNGNLELTKLLIQAGSELDALNKHFEGPLHLAVRMGHLDIIKLLVDSGCDVNLCEAYGNITPLHIAVNTYTVVDTFISILDHLARGGCWLNSRAFSSLESPLYRAVDLGKTGISCLLIQHGAHPNCDCPFGVTILHKACQRNDVEVVDRLLHCHIDWKRETWLDRDIHQSGINEDMLEGYDYGVPQALIGKTEMWFAIEEARHNPLTLMRICRIVIRDALGEKLFIKVDELPLPKKIKDFVKMNIL